MALIRRVDPKPGARLIFVGDIHGCFEELHELLDRIDPDGDDLVISVGDIVTKGPDVARCLDLWRDRGYLAVQGKTRQVAGTRPSAAAPFARESAAPLDCSPISAPPLVIDFPREVTAVHAASSRRT